MSENARPTPLHDLHVEAGARLVPFAGWRMPVQYGGVLDEHRAVRERAGLFDVSHMGELAVRGTDALAFLEHMTCNKVARLKPGRAQYTALTTPTGTFVDDMLIYRLAEDDFMLVVNAATTAKDLGWLEKHAVGRRISIEDQSERWALLALQGPRAIEIADRVAAEPPSSLRPFAFVRTELAGATCIVSRTGYTGEDGVEIYCPSSHAVAAWQAIMEAGEPAGLVPAGLGARDTLRLEARLMLYGNDIDETTTVLEADLGWIVKLNKGEFVGREALARQAEQGVTRKLVGFRMAGRAIARDGYAVLLDGREFGRVTSGKPAPTLGGNIGLAYVPVELSETGQAIEIDVRGRREPAEVVPTPFYKR